MSRLYGAVMTTHTPGPWTAADTHILAGNFEYLPTIKTGRAGRPQAEWEANANVIAAAPEMLAALRATVAHIDDDMNGRPVVLWKLREAVLAAISKAEGRS